MSPSRSSKAIRFRTKAVLTAAVGLILGGMLIPTVVQAASEDISGGLRADGYTTLTQYAKFRYKTAQSATSLNMWDFPWCTFGIRLALRSPSGTQVSAAVTWSTEGTKNFRTTDGYLLPAGSYAFNARGNAPTTGFCGNTPVPSDPWRVFQGTFVY